MLDSKEIEFDCMQASFIEHLSVVQRELEDYETTWQLLREKDKKISEIENLPIEIPSCEPSPSISNTNMKSFFMSFSSQTPIKKEIKNNIVFNQKEREKLCDEFFAHKPMGMYAYGGSGCGKTYFLDLLFSLLSTPYKQRMHFNEFMLRVHHSIFTFSSVGNLKAIAES
jgi:hypothetical protein